MIASSSAKAISAMIRALMLSRGLTRHDLAQVTGLDVLNLSNIITGNNVGERGRALIEAALDQPFWTDPVAFAQRRALRPFYGGDFAVADPLNLDSEAGKQFPVAEHIRPRAELLRRLGVVFEAPHAPAQTTPPPRGEDGGGASADLPPTDRADSAEHATSPASQP